MASSKYTINWLQAVDTWGKHDITNTPCVCEST